MKTLRIETKDKKHNQGIFCGLDRGIKIQGILRFYLLSFREPPQNVETLCKEVFSNPILQDCIFEDRSSWLRGIAFNMVSSIHWKEGVTDNTALCAKEALRLLGCEANVASGTVYFLDCQNSLKKGKKIIFENIKNKLANPLVQNIEIFTTQEFQNLNRFKNIKFPKMQLAPQKKVREIDLGGSDEALLKLSHKRHLALSLSELLAIKTFYQSQKPVRLEKKLPLWPTDVEIEILAQTWSEHCKHKIFAAQIDYKNKNNKIEKINSLYKTYIKNTTKQVRKNHKISWLMSVFSDNAGIVRFDKNLDLCIKVETHNSPSALDPYGGALTGILGVNRDILGCGLGARPIANMDVFCVGPLNLNKQILKEKYPSHLIAPFDLLQGVHKGVEDGGNRSGIPTINGAFCFHESYAGKPLIFVGTVGVLAQTSHGRNSFEKKIKPKDRVVVVGGPVGIDGLHGATFSSVNLEQAYIPSTAVQIGAPLTQKRVNDFLQEALEKNLYRAITDNGAGGLSSSVGEMATLVGGASIDLSLCPLKYPNLSPFQIMVSESQERMTLAVPPHCLESFLNLARLRSVEATDLGEFNRSGCFDVYFKKQLVASLSLKFLHEGVPKLRLKAEASSREGFDFSWTNLKKQKVIWRGFESLEKVALKILSDPVVQSKENWLRCYDHEVQAATHIKPFTGTHQDGVNNAGGVWLQPHGGSRYNGVLVGCGLAPQMSKYSSFLMAQMSVDEAVRNILCHGGRIDRIALLDNFCWPDPVESVQNPEGSKRLGQLVEACRGLSEICKFYGTPLVSGKDSMKNSFYGNNEIGEQVVIHVQPTLLITALGQYDIRHAVSSEFKQEGDIIYILGESSGGLLGSVFEQHVRPLEPVLELPIMNLQKNYRLYKKMKKLFRDKLLQSCHDVSEGGVFTSLCEAGFGARLGFEVLCSAAQLEHFLFSESSGRFLVSVNKKNKKRFELVMKGYFKKIGTVTKHFNFIFKAKTPLSKSVVLDGNPLLKRWKSLRRPKI